MSQNNDYDEDVEIEGEEQEEQSAYDAIMAQQAISAQDIYDHLTGPIIALVIHIIVLPILLTIVIIEKPSDKPPVTITSVKEETIPPPPPPPPPDPPPVTEIVETEVPVDKPVVNDHPTEDVATENLSLIEDTTIVEVPTAMAMRPNKSAKSVTGLYALRGGGKEGAVGRGGGGAPGQASLNRGLKWLADHQNEDGSWGDVASPYGNTTPALTGLAVLAFLAHGDTPDSPKYGNHVMKGIRKLIEFANNTGNNGGVRSDQHQYSHGIVAYALSEAYAMCDQLPIIKDAMDKTVTVIIKGMNSKGSYDYNYIASSSRCDLSYAGWNYQALKAAFAAGCTVEGLQQSLDKSIEGIKTCKRSDGSYGYTNLENNRSQATMTPVAALNYQLLGQPKCKEAVDAIDWLKNQSNGKLLEMDWKTGDGMTGLEYAWRIYAWYYQTQVLFQDCGGNGKDPTWSKWRKSFETALTKEQESDGHWETPYMKYGGKKNGFAEDLGSFGTELNANVYSTALCCLMLEVYYRFLPSYKLDHGAAQGGGAGKVEDTTLKIE